MSDAGFGERRARQLNHDAGSPGTLGKGQDGQLVALIHSARDHHAAHLARSCTEAPRDPLAKDLIREGLWLIRGRWLPSESAHGGQQAEQSPEAPKRPEAPVQRMPGAAALSKPPGEKVRRGS